MQEIPDCLNRRYKALDDLVKELSVTSDVDFKDDVSGSVCNEPGVRLMCDFWNILKENPDCNLTKAVQNKMDVSPKGSMFQPHKVSCYMAAHSCSKKDDDAKKPDSGGKAINQCCHKGAQQAAKSKCCGSKSLSSSMNSDDVLPLSKVLCNINEPLQKLHAKAASFDRKCQGMVNDLMAAQKQLQDQIQHLEHREEEGIQQLKKADCMWSCMEDAYKKKILESQERQQELLKQLKEAEASTNKWRKNKKDLEFQMENVNSCHQEISEKLVQKQNDLKCMNRDIADYKKRIENNKKEIGAAKKSVGSKKNHSNDKIKKLAGDISRREAMIREENAHKEEKEKEGNQYIKEARADLLNLSKVLLQKKIENEDLKTEKETLIEELELLSQSYDQCKDRCQSKKKSIEEEIKKIDYEITHYNAKCLRCHQCTDTVDIRKFCTDCPRCLEERECLQKDDHCSPDHTMDCVCMSVKQKFLDNVFENMYTVLERQIKTGPGKCVAETVLNCLKKSRNGKLDQDTRQILQDFILTTVKKNLNLTIVGGAVKTRCELDSETYKQLMLCLKQVKAARPPKADKQTAAKKPPCSRWGGESECNCPKGPKACICTKRAPPPPNEPGPCPPQDKEDKGEEKICPHKESAACGPDCAMHAVPSAVGTDVAAWRPDPCQGPTCMFKNMRAAQCVLGPEALNTVFDSRSFVTAVPYVPNISMVDDQISCKCGSSRTKPCTCKDIKTHPRERIIEEVMGKYFEVKPIDKVSAEKDYGFIDKKIRRSKENVYVCINKPLKKHIGVIASLNCNKRCNFYNKIDLTEMNRKMNSGECTFKYDYEDMIERDKGCSLKYFDNNKYSKADLEIQVASYSESKTSMITIKPEEVLVRRDKRLITENSIPSVNNNGNKTRENLRYSLYQEKVCSIAQELIKDIIVFDCKSKLDTDSSKEWISLESFVNEILNKPLMQADKDEIENIEVEIKTECLETGLTTYVQENNSTRTKIDIDTIYRNGHYDRSLRKNTKQMKVDTKVQCDDEICGMVHTKLLGDDSSSPLKKSHVLKNGLVFNEDGSKRFREVTNSDKSSLFEKITVDNKLKADLIKEQFQPLLVTKPIENENDLFENSKNKSLKNNARISSEQSIQDIDEHIIKLIENITEQNPSSYVSLKKTKSGHLTLDLNSSKDDDGQTMLVKRSPSGNMVIEIEKNAIHSLKSDKCKYVNKGSKTMNICNRDPRICQPESSKNKELCHSKVKGLSLDNSKENIDAWNINHHTICKDFLQNMYEKKNRNIEIIYKNRRKKLLNLPAKLKQTSSKNIAIYVKNTDIEDDNRAEFPVLLYTTESGRIIIDYDASSCNGIATRTASNGFLISVKKLNGQELKSFRQNKPKTQDVFKIRIKGIDDNIKQPPAVIKRTLSGNFDVVLEKEFEKCFQQTIQHQIVDNNESFFDLTKTSSSIILDFDKADNRRFSSQKALLMKSNSGLLKIIVSDATQNPAEEIGKRNESLIFGSVISAKALGELLRKLPSDSKLQKTNVSSPDTKKTKSSSDSHLYETAKIKLHSNQSLLDKSSTTLKKTQSGQFAVVLDKDLKKSFINKLLSYLDKSSKGVIPIKRTDSGEIIIAFDKNTGIGECESLKITPSGNIYVTVDEKNFREISNNVAVNTSCNSNISPYICKVERPENKAIATNCHAYLDDRLCDASRCACASLSNERYARDANLRLQRNSEGKSFIETPNASHNLCGKSKCPGARNKQSIKSNNKSPHIVIKPYEPHSEPDKRNNFHESYYCEVQSVCPYHKDRYDNISNELLEISGLCNNEQEKVISKVRTYRQIKQFMPKKNVSYDWNSFDYLPHQLPPFLRDITYS